LQLGGDEQQVVMLRFMEGFEFAEIASLLKKKEGNVRVISTGRWLNSAISWKRRGNRVEEV
jgi:DNA-directed RNA polymerase specialized sigma24 family protein